MTTDSKPHSELLERLWCVHDQLLVRHTSRDTLLAVELHEIRDGLIEQLEAAQQRWEEDMRNALKVRDRLERAEEFIDHLDASYRYEEWLAADEDESNPASEPKL